MASSCSGLELNQGLILTALKATPMLPDSFHQTATYLKTRTWGYSFGQLKETVIAKALSMVIYCFRYAVGVKGERAVFI